MKKRKEFFFEGKEKKGNTRGPPREGERDRGGISELNDSCNPSFFLYRYTDLHSKLGNIYSNR